MCNNECNTFGPSACKYALEGDCESIVFSSSQHHAEGKAANADTCHGDQKTEAEN
jgi:hypothetical protein